MTKRIGIHFGTTGGASNAVEQARAIGANTFQIFTSSPRMWRAPKVDPKQAARMKELRAALDVGPLVIHTSYLVNVCSQNEEVREKSVGAFRGEIERALAFGAEFLVLHPGSWKGLTRDEGLRLAADSIARAIHGLEWQGTAFHILIENTAGSEFSLGGSFEQVAELVERLRPSAPMGVCLDTCHTHVAGYDLVTAEGYEETMRQVAATVGQDAGRRATATQRIGQVSPQRTLPEPGVLRSFSETWTWARQSFRARMAAGVFFSSMCEWKVSYIILQRGWATSRQNRAPSAAVFNR